MTHEVKYVKCPDCGGRGQEMYAELWPTGHQELWRDCELCEGNGDIEEADYLIMKLEGIV